MQRETDLAVFCDSHSLVQLWRMHYFFSSQTMELAALLWLAEDSCDVRVLTHFLVFNTTLQTMACLILNLYTPVVPSIKLGTI